MCFEDKEIFAFISQDCFLISIGERERQTERERERDRETERERKRNYIISPKFIERFIFANSTQVIFRVSGNNPLQILFKLILAVKVSQRRPQTVAGPAGIASLLI
jgi:hypothetical protein